MNASRLSAIGGLALLAYSSTASAALQTNGVLDEVLTQFHNQAAAWQVTITHAASWLFWTLAIISMVWTFGMKALRTADIGEFFAEFVRFTIFTGFFWWLLLNGPHFADTIIAGLRQLGANAGGVNALTPSSIVDVGFAIFNRAVQASSLWSPMTTLIGILLSAAILLLLTGIAVNMLLLLIAGWMLSYAGIIFLGFGGSRWTSDIAINYYRTVLGVAAQLMTIVLLVGIGSSLLSGFYQKMTLGPPNLDELAVMLVIAFTLYMLVDKVPPLMAGIAGSSAVGGVGNFGAGAIVGAAAGAASVGAAVASGGTSNLLSGATSAAGAGSALSAAIGQASRNVGAGTDVLSTMAGGGRGAGSGGPSSGLNKIAGMAMRSATSGGMAGAMSMAGRVGADAATNLAKGAGKLAKDKAGDVKDAAQDRIGQTTGGRIASAIREMNAGDESSPAPTDPADEIAAFVNNGNNG